MINLVDFVKIVLALVFLADNLNVIFLHEFYSGFVTVNDPKLLIFIRSTFTLFIVL